MKLIDLRPQSFSRVLWRHNNIDAARGRATALYPKSLEIEICGKIYPIKVTFDEESMEKKTTSNGSDWEKICRKICCLKLAQLIKSANRLHIFGIRSFDNTKYFKIDKWISLREICIEIDHFPIQPFPLLRASSRPQLLCDLCLT